MTHTHVRSQAAAPCHKAEAINTLVVNGSGLGSTLVYLVPIQVDSILTVNEYNIDATIVGADTWTLTLAIYRQVDRVESTGVVAIKVDNTEVTSTGLTAGAQIAFAMSGNVTLLPGSYWIATQAIMSSADTGGRFIYNNAITGVSNSLYLRWLYYDAAGAGLDADYNGAGTELGDASAGLYNEYPWAAVRYTGDALP